MTHLKCVLSGVDSPTSPVVVANRSRAPATQLSKDMGNTLSKDIGRTSPVGGTADALEWCHRVWMRPRFLEDHKLNYCSICELAGRFGVSGKNAHK